LAEQILFLHEARHAGDSGLVLAQHVGSRLHQPDFARVVDLLAGEEGDGFVHLLLLLAEVQHVAVGLAVVEHAVGAREGLDQAVVLEVLVHVQGVEVLGVEAGEQHVHDDGDVDLLGVVWINLAQVGVGVLLILDALLHVLVIEIEFADAVAGSVAGVVVGDDAGERGLLAFWVLLVVGLFLRQVFLNLLHVLIAFGGRGEDAGDVERCKIGVLRPDFALHGLEQVVVFDGVVNAGGGQDGVEFAVGGGGVVLGQNGPDHLALGWHHPVRLRLPPLHRRGIGAE